MDASNRSGSIRAVGLSGKAWKSARYGPMAKRGAALRRTVPLRARPASSPYPKVSSVQC